ncbi:MAG: ribonuclease R, partial [Nitratireductor sp.]
MATPKKPPTKKKRDRKPKKPDVTLPTRDQIMAFVTESPGKVGKREIAKAFGISGSQRIGLKRILKELTQEGLLKKEEGKSLAKPGEMPPVAVIDITKRDQDGELIATPNNWSEDAPIPQIVIVPGDANDRQRGAPAGVGDRVLARITKT